jgi:hypothetical protein
MPRESSDFLFGLTLLEKAEFVPCRTHTQFAPQGMTVEVTAGTLPQMCATSHYGFGVRY